MKGNILVVDDDRALCELAETGLSAAGFEVTWTTDPGETLKLIEAKAPDAVVADLNMQGVNGLELCQRGSRWSKVSLVVRI